MRIGLFFDSDYCSNVDFSKCIESNPGVGGSEWEFLKLAFLLSKNHEIYFFTTTKYKHNYPFENIVCKDIHDALKKADDSNLQFIIHRHIFNQTFTNHKCKRVLWAHNDCGYKELKKQASTNQLWAIVFVSCNEMNKYLFNPKIRKLAYVCYNFIGHYKTTKSSFEGLNVAYIGIPASTKRFQFIVNAWPLIIKKIPDAKLHIFGSNKLYGSKQDIIDNFKSDESMICHGTVNIDENNSLSNIDVGLTSSCYIEEFCLSLTDFQRYSIPLVTLNYGVFNEVAPKKCSLKFITKRKFAKQVIKLLKNKKLSKKLGENGYKNCDRFSDEKILCMWNKVITQKNHHNIFEIISGLKTLLFNKLFAIFFDKKMQK